MGRSAEVLADRGLDLSFRNGAHHPAALNAVFEENQQRDSVNAEVPRRERILVDVQLCEADVFALAGKLLENRRDHAARTAPWRPEVDDRRPLRDLFLEVGIAQGDRMTVAISTCAKRRLAGAAHSFFAGGKLSDSIGLSTGRTPDYAIHTVLYCESEAIIAE